MEKRNKEKNGKKGILEDVLVRSRSEVLDMLLTEYDAKRACIQR